MTAPPVNEFIAETMDLLEAASRILVSGSDNLSADKVDELYRSAHTVKGSANLFGYTVLGNIAHSLESLLDLVREQIVDCSESIVDTCLYCIDQLKFTVGEIRDKGSDHGAKEAETTCVSFVSSQLLIKLKADLNPSCELDFPASILSLLEPLNTARTQTAPPPDDSDHQQSDHQPTVKSVAPSPEPESAHTRDSEKSSFRESGEVRPDSSDNINHPKPGDNAMNQKKSSEVPEGAAAKKDAPRKPSSGRSGVGGDSSMESTEMIRVPVTILENLMNLVGELVLVRNQHLQFASHLNNSDLGNLNQRLNYVTGELQTEVMKTRMQRIDTILSKFMRVVRDLSKNLGKKISLHLEGRETELDKTLLEAIKDPLMHIVRNAVDHGLEIPEDRESAGKTPEGNLAIKAYHEGGQVIVEIEDDGKGLDSEKIAAKAIQKGLASAQEIANMSERDIFMFIFNPGLSTAEKVSNLSGRGVGMDVVKTNIEKIGGTIDVTSTRGRGTAFKLKIPLTLAIIPALIVRSGKEHFSIPQVKLVELVRLEKNSDGEAIEIEEIQGAPVYRLRGQILPLVRLNEVLDLTPDDTRSTSENIVVLHGDSGIFGLIVDEIEDSTDIVIKPLMQFLKDLSVYSGATILGDGTIALTLDVVGLANRAGIFSQNENTSVVADASKVKEKEKMNGSEYLLVDIGRRTRYGIPLCLVNRLEDFAANEISEAGNLKVIRYRDSLLPIYSVHDHLFSQGPATEDGGSDTPEEQSSYPVVVVNKSGKIFGLQVKSITDVVMIYDEINPDIKDHSGVMGSTVYDEDIIVIIDVFKILDNVTKGTEFEQTESSDTFSTDQRSRFRILYADDDQFYRTHISKILEEAGYRVDSVEDGKKALDRLLSKQTPYDLILSDIEMPVMGGFEFAENARSHKIGENMPMIAISSRYNVTQVEKSKKAGFDVHLEKVNPKELIESVDQLLRSNNSMAA